MKIHNYSIHVEELKTHGRGQNGDKILESYLKLLNWIR